MSSKRRKKRTKKRRGDGHDPSLMADTRVQQRIGQAVLLYEQKLLSEAEQICQEVLTLAPDYFVALHLLGVIRQQQGEIEESIRLIGKALERNPNVGASSQQSWECLAEAGQIG